MKKRRQWEILTVIVLISWAVIFWKNLDYQYTFQGLETTIGEDSYVGVSNYEVEDNAYRVTGEDPQLYLKSEGTVGGMRIL